MTLARTWSVGLAGVQGAMVEVEVDMAPGCPAWCSSGCPTPSCGSRSTGSGRRWSTPAREFPQRRITIGLSPASMPKQGSGFDLALAAAVLAAAGAVPGGAVDRPGAARRARPGRLGAGRSAACCRPCWPRPGRGTGRSSCRPANADEAALVDGIEVLPAAHAGRSWSTTSPARAPLTRHVRGAAARRRCRRCPTWATWSGRPPGGGRWRWPRPAGTTCS